MGYRAQLVPLILSLCLTGCFKDAEVMPDSELQIAIKSIPDEYLKHCEGLGERPGDMTGDLLQDFNTAATLGGICQARHDSLVGYLAPLLQKLNPPKGATP